MALRYYVNAPATSLSASISASDTACTVASVADLPTQFPYTLILDRGVSAEEVVDVTAAVGTTLTITRGVDGTVAQLHAAGSAVEHGVSARDPREANAHVNATANVHGGTGSVVDTGSAQSITGAKTFTTLSTAAGGAVVTVNGAQTIAGDKTFTGGGNLPKGIIVILRTTTDSGLSAGAGSDIAVMGVSAALVAGRRYRVATYVHALPTTSGGNVITSLRDLTADVFIQRDVPGATSLNSAVTSRNVEMIIHPGSTGSVTFQTWLQSSNGTIKMDNLAGERTSLLYVEDLGLAS